MKFSTIITFLTAGIAMASPKEKCDLGYWTICQHGCSQYDQACQDTCYAVRYFKEHLI